ncbi:Hypothetical predicted protein, partial [Pelobates cultripes]
KGLQAHSPANKTGQRLISPHKSTLVGVVKTIPPAHPVTQTEDDTRSRAIIKATR